MAIDRGKRRRINAKLKQFYLTDFPFAKRNLIESRQAPGIEIEDPNLWMRHRNALDRVAEVQAMLAGGQVPDSSDDPEQIVEWASYLIRNTAVEAWAQASSFVIGRLSRILEQFDTRGDTTAAREWLSKAQESEGTARRRRSTAMGGDDGSIAHYRRAVELANRGIQVVHEASPSERKAMRMALWAIGIGILGSMIGVAGILVSIFF